MNSLQFVWLGMIDLWKECTMMLLYEPTLQAQDIVYQDWHDYI